MLQVDEGAIDMVGAERAASAALLPTRTEHGMRHDELTPAVKQAGKSPLPLRAIERVTLLHLHLGQTPTLPINLIALTS